MLVHFLKTIPLSLVVAVVLLVGSSAKQIPIESEIFDSASA